MSLDVITETRYCMQAHSMLALSACQPHGGSGSDLILITFSHSSPLSLYVSHIHFGHRKVQWKAIISVHDLVIIQLLGHIKAEGIGPLTSRAALREIRVANPPAQMTSMQWYCDQAKNVPSLA